ncbi:MAG: hypothetical protein Q4F95_15265 [Oscillospiraceae bacterium]|nr:hypothetical protein [Oscillospiraceae bacterium]
MDKTDSQKKPVLKGAVLFTVLTVMFVMIIIVLTTITLAGTASKRAYSSWYDNQTNYTAQSFVDGVVSSFRTDQSINNNLGAKIVASLTTKGQVISVDVSADGSTNIPGYGNIKSLTFTYVGDNTKDYYMGGVSASSLANQKIIKVSAEVEMGGETSTYSKYVVGEVKGSTTDGNGGGYNALGSNPGGEGSSTSPKIMGSTYVGIDPKYDLPGAAKLGPSVLGNNALIMQEAFYNSPLRVNSSTRFVFGRNDPATNNYSGLVVLGDFKIENNANFESQYKIPNINLTTKDQQEAENISNLPYIYTSGKLTFQTNPAVQGPFNFYCDTIQSTNTLDLKESNLFCKGTGLSVLGAQTKLLDWAGSVVTTDSADINDLRTGNIYCMGNLRIGNNTEINGDLYVKGNLDITSLNNPGDLKVSGGVYVGQTISVGGGKNKNDIIQAGMDGATEKIYDHISGLTGYTAYNSTVSMDAAVNEAFTDKKTMAAPDGTTVNDCNVIQTIDNLRSRFYDDIGGVKKYKDVVNTSGYTGTVKYDLSTIENNKVFTSSCIWTGELDNKTVYINPGPSELWINLENFSTKNYCDIIVDDSQGGSVKFFITSGNFNFIKGKIVTAEYFAAVHVGATLNLEKYPGAGSPLGVPHIYLYAAESNNCNINFAQSGPVLFTGDIIAPGAKLKWDNSDIKCTVNYKSYTYIDANKDGTIDSNDQINPINVTNYQNVNCIGSIEVGDMVNVTNDFGYINVDDPPFATPDLAAGSTYSWTSLDGYSTY